MSPYRQVNSVIRALELLEILNRQKFTSIELLHKLSGLPKPTIIRLLSTLSNAGFVAKDGNGKGYRITSAVTALSCGYQGAPLVVEAARPWAQELTKRIRWPVAVAVLDENAALVSYTTSAESPMSPYQGILHRRFGLLSRALGRAYLAFCPMEERRLILEILKRTQHPDSGLEMTDEEIHSMLDAVARQGFAVRASAPEKAASASLAVPVFEEGSDRVLATIGITYYNSAVSGGYAVNEYVPLLRTAAANISESVAHLQRKGIQEDVPDSGSSRAGVSAK